MRVRRLIASLSLLTLLSLLCCPHFLFAENHKPSLQAPLFNNLGTFHHPISTTSPLAQRFFDQGFVLYYSFEWGESIRSFKEAIRLDPNCAMCYWGLALALGDKGNAPMTGHEYSDARTAIQKALVLAARKSPVEQAYIKALALRFQHPPKSVNTGKAFSCHANGSESASPKELSQFANAMKKFTLQYPHDNDAKALYAFALFDIIKWQFWDKNGKINKDTPTLIKSLDAILANDKFHIGGNHYYIHVIEQSPHPEQALINAKRLKSLVPGSEHLVHMPTHIYFLTGRYHEGTDSNLQAIAAYQHYSKMCQAQGFKPEITYLYHHDFDFLRTTATMEGRKQVALTAARQLMKNIPASWIAADHDLQWFIHIPYSVKARFGMWNDLLKEPKPNSAYQHALGMWYYIQGMAHANIGNLKAANRDALNLQDIIKKGAIKSTLGKQGHNLLKIANDVLAATIANFNHDEKSTIAHLKNAVKIQHDMGYHEPPDWYFPVKEALGDAYLKWNHPEEAKNMYEQDLKQYPDNGWALYGLAKSLRMQGHYEEAAHVEKVFKKSWKYADIPAPIMLFTKDSL